ncbi:hypothetical protein Hanom_Chr16g01516471 [Helianthus anomalus]
MDAPAPKTPNAKLNQQKRPQDESSVILQRRDAENDRDVKHLLYNCQV